MYRQFLSMNIYLHLLICVWVTVFRKLYLGHCVLGHCVWVTVFRPLCSGHCVWVTVFWLLASPRAPWSYFLNHTLLFSDLQGLGWWGAHIEGYTQGVPREGVTQVVPGREPIKSIMWQLQFVGPKDLVTPRVWPLPLCAPPRPTCASQNFTFDAHRWQIRFACAASSTNLSSSNGKPNLNHPKTATFWRKDIVRAQSTLSVGSRLVFRGDLRLVCTDPCLVPSQLPAESMYGKMSKYHFPYQTMFEQRGASSTLSEVSKDRTGWYSIWKQKKHSSMELALIWGNSEFSCSDFGHPDFGHLFIKFLAILLNIHNLETNLTHTEMEWNWQNRTFSHCFTSTSTYWPKELPKIHFYIFY